MGVCLLNTKRNNWGWFSRFSRRASDEPPTPVIPSPMLVANSRPCFFITFFLYRPHRHANRNRAIIHRQYSIENCARLQRWTQNPPQTISGGSLTKGRQVHK